MANFKFLLLPFYDFFFQIEESITYLKASYHASRRSALMMYMCAIQSQMTGTRK
jgi:hypothetical protein